MKTIAVAQLVYIISLGLLKTAFATTYTVHPIPLHFDEYNVGIPTDLAENNSVIGVYEGCPASTIYCILAGFIYDIDNGKAIKLEPLPGNNATIAQGISPDGSKIVGESYSGGVLNDKAVLWNSSGKIQKSLKLPEGRNYSNARRINDEGYVVGITSVDEFDMHATFWDLNQNSVKELPLDHDSYLFDIMSGGKTGVGYRQPTENPTERIAIRWLPEEGLIDLKELGGGWSEAYAINKNGITVGFSRDINFISHAVVWDKEGKILEVLPTSEHIIAIAHDINEKGQIVGEVISDILTNKSNVKDNIKKNPLFNKLPLRNLKQKIERVEANNYSYYEYGYIYEDGKVIDLNELLDNDSKKFEILSAYAINNNGLILAFAVDKEMRREIGVLLIPHE